MISTVKSYAELCLENQRLREENKQLKQSNRRSLLMKVLHENLVLEAEIEVYKNWVSYLEARLNRNA